MLKSGTVYSSPVNRSRLSTKPVVCRSAIPNSTFMVRQVWIAASLNVRDLPLLPEGLAAQFVVLLVGDVSLLMPASYHTGFAT